MKRILIPILLIVAVWCFCAFATDRVKTVCLSVESLLQEAEAAEARGRDREAEAIAARARELWDAHRGLLGTALRHTASDDITVSFPPLLEAARSGDREDFLQRSRELRAALHALWEMEEPYYYNVL